MVQCIARASNDPLVIQWEAERKERERQERARLAAERREAKEARALARTRREIAERSRQTRLANEAKIEQRLGGNSRVGKVRQAKWLAASESLTRALHANKAVGKAIASGRKSYGRARELMVADEEIGEVVRPTKAAALKLIEAGKALIEAGKVVNEWAETAEELN